MDKLERGLGMRDELVSEIRFIIYGADGNLEGIISSPAYGFPGEVTHRELSELTESEIAKHPPLRRATERTLRHSE